jgi:hypothetical protein
MLLPRKVTRVPAVDKSVTDTASARAHEYGWHIDVGVSAVRGTVEPEEAKTFGTKEACDASCSNLKKRVPDLFRNTVRRTQDAENARAKGGR